MHLPQLISSSGGLCWRQPPPPTLHWDYLVATLCTTLASSAAHLSADTSSESRGSQDVKLKTLALMHGCVVPCHAVFGACRRSRVEKDAVKDL